MRDTCARDEGPIDFLDDGANDALTLRSLMEIAGSLAAVSEEARLGRDYAASLLAACDEHGRLPKARRGEVGMLVETLESKLA